MPPLRLNAHGPGKQKDDARRGKHNGPARESLPRSLGRSAGTSGHGAGILGRALREVNKMEWFTLPMAHQCLGHLGKLNLRRMHG